MKLFRKKVVSIALAVLMVTSILVCGVVSAGAEGWSNSGTSYLYFDYTNLPGNWTKAKSWVLFCDGTNVYAGAINTSVSNAKLVYKNMDTIITDSTVTPENIEFVTIVCGDSLKKGYIDSKTNIFNSNNELTDSAKNKYGISNFTNNYSGALNSSAQRYCFYADASRDLHLAGPYRSYTDLNFTQTVNVIGNGTIKGTYYSFGNSVSNLNIADNVTVSSTFDAARATNVSLSADEPGEGNKFVGWFSDSECTQSLGDTTTPLVYTVDGTRTIYAKFTGEGSEEPTETPSETEDTTPSPVHSLYAAAGANGTAAVSSSTAAEGETAVFTATPNENYVFNGWYSDQNYLNASLVSMSNPCSYTVGESDVTLYAQFIPSADATEPTEPAKNNASRHVNSTALSKKAMNYYKEELRNVEIYQDGNNSHSFGEDTDNSDNDNYVYKTFVDLANKQTNDKSNSYDVAQNNDLYTSLHNIMRNTKDHDVVYAAYGNNSLAHYWLTTDTSNENYDKAGFYTFFYSDVDDYNHIDMQREHIWPKSKASYLMKTGLGGSDLHHLRPAYGKVNNIKSNWGFASIHNDYNNGFKSGWTNYKTVYWPSEGNNRAISLWRAEKNGETFCDYKKDVRGDIARIILYVYTTWNEYNLYSDITTTDTDGEKIGDMLRLRELDDDDNKNTGERVFYDLPTLLKWMKEDPVSEWEMLRNDLTQNIQGNRNVFIDYPELAWLLFDENVPQNMITPSGMANGGTDIAKIAEPTFNSPVTLDFKEFKGNGKADVKAYNNTTGKTVKNGDAVERGDSITYTVIPDESDIEVIRYSNNDGNGLFPNYYTATTNPRTPYPLTDGKFIFTKRAGYNWENEHDTDPNENSTEKLYIKLNSKSCELNLKIGSRTAAGTNAGGSASGMVTARIKGTHTIIENGGTVPNGTDVILSFTPDYGSRFVTATSQNVNFTTSEISGAPGCYEAEVRLDCSPDKSRTIKINIYFAQTFNAGTADEKAHHIYNKGMRPDSTDTLGNDIDFTSNFQICGVQLKTVDGEIENKALRFVSVIDKKILDKAEEYGYVIGYTKQNLDSEITNRYAYTLTYNGSRGLTVDCTDTDNNIFGDYGKHDLTTNYKYITAAVNNLQEVGENGVGTDTTIIARPYVKLKSEYVGTGAPNVIYGEYVYSSTGEAFCACSASYNDVYKLAYPNGEGS